MPRGQGDTHRFPDRPAENAQKVQRLLVPDAEHGVNRLVQHNRHQLPGPRHPRLPPPVHLVHDPHPQVRDPRGALAPTALLLLLLELLRETRQHGRAAAARHEHPQPQLVDHDHLPATGRGARVLGDHLVPVAGGRLREGGVEELV